MRAREAMGLISGTAMSNEGSSNEGNSNSNWAFEPCLCPLQFNLSLYLTIAKALGPLVISDFLLFELPSF